MMRNYAGYRRCLALMLAFALLLPAGTPAAAGGAQGSGGPVPVEVADATPTPAADAQELEIVPVSAPPDGETGATPAPSGDGAATAAPYSNNGDETGGATPAPGGNGATPTPSDSETGATPDPSPDGAAAATPVPADALQTPLPEGGTGASLAEALSALPEGQYAFYGITEGPGGIEAVLL